MQDWIHVAKKFWKNLPNSKPIVFLYSSQQYSGYASVAPGREVGVWGLRLLRRESCSSSAVKIIHSIMFSVSSFWIPGFCQDWIIDCIIMDKPIFLGYITIWSFFYYGCRIFLSKLHFYLRRRHFNQRPVIRQFLPRDIRSWKMDKRSLRKVH